MKMVCVRPTFDLRQQAFDRLILGINSRLHIEGASNNIGELEIHYPNRVAGVVDQNIFNPNVSMDHAKGMNGIIGDDDLRFKCWRQT